jgi:hypothetical protein
MVEMSMMTSLEMTETGGPLVFCIRSSTTSEVLEIEEGEETMMHRGLIVV